MNQVVIYILMAILLLLGIIAWQYGIFGQAKLDAITLIFGGDTMLGRLVNETINEKGIAYPWGNVAPLLQNADVTLVNLETTLTNATHAVPKVFNFKATPDKVEALVFAGIDVVNLANNHILDFDIEGMQETIATLDRAGILHVGAGKTLQEAKQEVIITKNSITIGIIGYTDNEPDWKAGDNKPGVNYIRIGDNKEIQKDIARVRPLVDILIVTCHWGPNMRDRPSDDFIKFAHTLIDSGVDIIHGHSAHVLQGIEVYKNKLIIYDSGDLVNDYAVDDVMRNDRSALFQVTVNKNGLVNLKIIPILIKDMQVNVAKGKEQDAINTYIFEHSAQFGTQLESDASYIFK